MHHKISVTRLQLTKRDHEIIRKKLGIIIFLHLSNARRRRITFCTLLVMLHHDHSPRYKVPVGKTLSKKSEILQNTTTSIFSCVVKIPLAQRPEVFRKSQNELFVKRDTLVTRASAVTLKPGPLYRVERTSARRKSVLVSPLLPSLGGIGPTHAYFSTWMILCDQYESCRRVFTHQYHQ